MTNSEIVPNVREDDEVRTILIKYCFGFPMTTVEAVRCKAGRTSQEVEASPMDRNRSHAARPF